MKCFYHEDRESVAFCQDCGKGLCKECASKYSPCLCEECAQKRRANKEYSRVQKKEEHRKLVVGEFKSMLVPGIIWGIIFLVVVGIFSFMGGFSFEAIRDTIGAGLIGFFAAYGWKACAGYQPTFVDNPIWAIIVFGIRFLVSIIIGLPCFVFSVIKYVKGKEVNRRM